MAAEKEGRMICSTECHMHMLRPIHSPWAFFYSVRGHPPVWPDGVHQSKLVRLTLNMPRLRNRHSSNTTAREVFAFCHRQVQN